MFRRSFTIVQRDRGRYVHLSVSAWVTRERLSICHSPWLIGDRHQRDHRVILGLLVCAVIRACGEDMRCWIEVRGDKRSDERFRNVNAPVRPGPMAPSSAMSIQLLAAGSLSRTCLLGRLDVCTQEAFVV